MFIGNFGNNADGRPQLLLGITPKDLISVLAQGGRLHVNADEDPNEPLPIHLILMIDESHEAIEATIEDVIQAKKEREADGQDDV